MRIRRNMSQQELANNLDLSRSKLNSYERGVQPPFQTLIFIADYFNLSIDALIRYDLSKLSEYQLSQMEQGFDIDVTGQKLRLLTISVDKDENEHIEMVPARAQAGYTTGYADPEFILSLPRFNLPFLAKGKTYRCFQIKGESMLPIREGSWITASYVQNWEDIKDGKSCIIVTLNDGIVFKVVYNKIREEKKLLLVSTNPVFKPYELPLGQIVEIWQMESFIGFND
ncbi:MAG: LexA family transcriptional regulator [Flavobacteriales bacterium]|nr:LexA family transcriptional regulator [Bacteroidota bacterium]MCB9240473.1 LexA family transcriptional regulator [Flavobacteriales bacterium]